MTGKRNGDTPSVSSQAEELAALKQRREKRKLRRKGEKEIKTGLTSMIDIVFLLIFFFMVVTDLQSMEIEEIELPFASRATPDEPPIKDRIVVNVDQNGRVRVMGYTLESEDLFRQLRRAAADGPQDEETGLPGLAVKVRADKAVEYAKVQDVMVQCMRTKLWNLSFGTRPDHDDRGLMIAPEPQ
ncbi:MAG: ExbD/TolR family protein [Planctomycetota bacterium]